MWWVSVYKESFKLLEKINDMKIFLFSLSLF